MKPFAIITDSCANMEEALRKQYDVKEIKMHYFYGDKVFEAGCDFPGSSAKEFYDLMRKGQTFTSSNANAAEYRAAFEEEILNGKDVLSISCTGALSSSVNESFVAKRELNEKYPDAKIICIDSENACYSIAMIVIEAAKMRAEGKTIEEVAEWINQNKRDFCEVGSVDKLTYLKRAGRISATAAFFGGILAVKPIIFYNDVGYNVAVEKVKGRNTSLERSAELLAKYINTDKCTTIYIAHADCLDEAKKTAEKIQAKLPNVKLNFHYGYIEPCIGRSVGPGTIIIDFWGSREMRVKC